MENRNLNSVDVNRTAAEAVTEEKILHSLRGMGISSGDSVVVKAALSEVGAIEGGPHTVVEALLKSIEPGGSVFGLAYTPLYKLPLSRKNREKIVDIDTPAYSGKLINCMIDDSRFIRSHHPAHSFVGSGPLAESILPTHGPDSYALEPLLELTKYDNSKSLLLGTINRSPGAAGTLHNAHMILGMERKPLKKEGVMYKGDDGSVKLYRKNYLGGCSMGFGNLYPAYEEAGAVVRGKIGKAECMVINMKTALSVDLEILKKDPGAFFCDNPLCYSCRVSWAHSTTPLWRFALRWMFNKLKSGTHSILPRT